MSAVTFMTANYVARQTGWAMHGWGHGDRLTNEWFTPLETYGERLDDVLARIRALGFETVDLWGAHLGADWATDEHLAVANDLLARHGLVVTTYAAWVSPANVRRVCELARGLGVALIGAGFSGDAAELAPVLREHGVRLAVENHPERTPAEVLAKIGAGAGTMGATIDTGWWATQGYDPARAIEELGEHVLHVHLKDVVREGEPHDTCRWGEGVVDIERCVRALQRIRYGGAFVVEHEPEDHDPSEECAAMRVELEGWLQ
jgi:L-ribulose-5-phosphate 3-epimerase